MRNWETMDQDMTEPFRQDVYDFMAERGINDFFDGYSKYIEEVQKLPEDHIKRIRFEDNTKRFNETSEFTF